MDVTLEDDQIHALSRDASRSPPLPTGAETSAGLRQQDDQTDRVYAKRFPVLNSDTARQSPWSGKLLLSLDGGGIRGYSSLLILRRLLAIVAGLELGESKLIRDSQRPWTLHPSSSHCPWYRDMGADPSERTHSALEANRDVNIQLPGPEITETRAGEPSNATQEAIPESIIVPVNISTSPAATADEVLPGSSQVAHHSEADLDKFRIHHYFDYIVGTSTGGLSAVMLSRLKMDINKALQEYNLVGNTVFARPRPLIISVGGLLVPRYKSRNMREALRQVVEHGSEKETRRTGRLASEIMLVNENPDSCHTAVVAFGGSNVHTPYVFRTYTHPRNTEFSGENTSTAMVWEVARATSAAPRYFSPQQIGRKKFLDGGIGCNNPAQEICNEIQAVHGRIPELIVSIGTGIRIENDEDSQDGIEKPGILDVVKQKGHKFFDNARGVIKAIKVLPEAVTNSEPVHRGLQSTTNTAAKNCQKIPYYRFNVPDIASMVELDQWIPSETMELPNGEETLQRLERATNDYMDDATVTKRMQECAQELVRVRRERAETERWERFATHTIYRCPEKGCDLEFSCREKLRLHASERHEIVPRVMMVNQSICLIDQCMETPQYHDSDTAFKEHLQGTPHFMQDPDLKSPAGFEEWLDSGRRPEHAIHAEPKRKGRASQQQNGTPAPPIAAKDIGDGQKRKMLSKAFGRKPPVTLTPNNGILRVAVAVN